MIKFLDTDSKTEQINVNYIGIVILYESTLRAGTSLDDLIGQQRKNLESLSGLYLTTAAQGSLKLYNISCLDALFDYFYNYLIVSGVTLPSWSGAALHLLHLPSLTQIYLSLSLSLKGHSRN